MYYKTAKNGMHVMHTGERNDEHGFRFRVFLEKTVTCKEILADLYVYPLATRSL
jgi:hypothetical protein